MKRMPALSLLTVVAAACTQLAGLTDVPPAVDDDAGTSGGASTSGSSTSGPGSSGGSASALSDGGSSGFEQWQQHWNKRPRVEWQLHWAKLRRWDGKFCGKTQRHDPRCDARRVPDRRAGGCRRIRRWGRGRRAAGCAESGVGAHRRHGSGGSPRRLSGWAGPRGQLVRFRRRHRGRRIGPSRRQCFVDDHFRDSRGRGTAAHAAHITANSGFTIYGAGMGFSLNASPTTPHPYDASAYQGFTFWARALGDAATTIVRFNVLDKNTTLVSGGGVCDGGTCNAYYGFTLTLTNAWQSFTVSYADLERPSYALPDGLPFDPSNMMGCQFLVSQGVAFDLWVNDIYFVDK